MKTLKNIVLFIGLFIVFYFETVSINGVTISHIWKIPVFVFMVLYILRKGFAGSNSLIISNYVWGVKNLLNTSIINYTSETIISAFKVTYFGLMHHFFNSFIKSELIIKEYIIKLSVFMIMSSVPFLIGIIDPLGLQLDFSMYGYADEKGYVGLFQTPHAAGIITSAAVINLIYFYNSETKNKSIFVLLILLGTYVVFATFVRTAILMLIFGLFVLYRDRLLLLSNWVKVVPYILIVYLVFTSTFDSDLFSRRLLNENIYSQDRSSVNVSSGRTLFWLVNVEKWYSSMGTEFIIGIGEENAKDYLHREVGIRVFSHNAFVDALIQNGLFGMIIYLSFLIAIYRRIFKSKSSKYYNLNISIFSMYLILQFFQGGNFFAFDLIFAMNLTLLKASNISNE